MPVGRARNKWIVAKRQSALASEMKPKITLPETEKMSVRDTAARIFVDNGRYKSQTKETEAKNARA